MNFKILCRSFEARTKPYQIKQTESKSAKKWQRSRIFHWFWARTHGRTNGHTHVRSPFHSPLTNFIRRGQLLIKEKVLNQIDDLGSWCYYNEEKMLFFWYPTRWKKITVDQSKVLKNRLYRLFRFWGATRYKASLGQYWAK